MSGREALSIAVEHLRAHKLRSGLTMLGMIFGVGAVIAMLSIGSGMEREARATLERLGLRNVLVRAKDLRDEELKEVRKKSPGLTFRDAEAILDAVPGVELAAPRIEVETWAVVAAGRSSEAKVFGVKPEQARLANLGLIEGRFIDGRDEATHAQVCVIGPAVRRDLFGYGQALGQHLRVNDLWCEVIGVLAGSAAGQTSIQGVYVGSAEREIDLPLATVLRKLERKALASPLTEIVVRLEPGGAADAVAPVIGGLVDRLHGGAKDFDLVVPEALLAQSRRTERLFSIVMGCIAGIALLVGGIGIMNIMLATVLERTREIGVRRALGARRRDIRQQFMFESFALSFLGGAAGVLLGVGIAYAVAAWAGWATVVTPASILLSTGVSLGVGLASGIYPAVRAAGLDPIEALRHE